MFPPKPSPPTPPPPPPTPRPPLTPRPPKHSPLQQMSPARLEERLVEDAARERRKRQLAAAADYSEGDGSPWSLLEASSAADADTEDGEESRKKRRAEQVASVKEGCKNIGGVAQAWATVYCNHPGFFL